MTRRWCKLFNQLVPIFHMKPTLLLVERRVTNYIPVVIEVSPFSTLGTRSHHNINLPLLMAPWVTIETTSRASSDNEVGILTTVSFQYRHLHTLTSSSLCIQYEAYWTMTGSGSHTICILLYFTKPMTTHFVGTRWNETEHDNILARKGFLHYL